MKSASNVAIDVPFFSQHTDVRDESWKNRACGAVCLAMVLAYHNGGVKKGFPSVNELIQEGIAIKATNEAGWIHTRLSLLAHNHGFPAYNEEFKSVSVNYEKQKFSESKYAPTLMEYGIKKLVSTLRDSKPVIVSVSKRFKENDTFHQVVLTGFRGEGVGVAGFFFNDPDFDSAKEGKDKFVDLKTFKEHWRRFAIFVA